jgi:LysR family transcriptional regulator, mexEF-oprN operon transcriptional activator
MNTIDLRKFDLNLLIVFEVLLSERSVTRTAERLGRTQSAISHALSRLRVQLGDPVMVKGGKFMQPTPFALDFLEEVRPILARIQRALSPRHSFDPKTSRRIFRISAPDFALTLFTHLHARLRAEAPNAAIEWTGLKNSMMLDLAEGQIDVAIAPAPPRLTQDVLGDGIGALQWRCFARKGHPAFLKWGSKAWSRWPHLGVRLGTQIENPVDVAATKAGLERTIAGWVPHFAAIAPVLAASDLLTTVPSLCLADSLNAFDIESRHVPFSIAPMQHALLWSASRRNDPEIKWLRDRLRPLVAHRVVGFRVEERAGSRRNWGQLSS